MQTIEVTDAQHAFITQLREELSREVVGRYGICRECDAVQFLLDNMDAEFDLDETFDLDVETDGTEVSFEEDGTPSPDETDTSTDDAPADSAENDGDATADGDGDDTSDDSDGDASSGGSADDDELLDRMMNLLDTHDDKWGESPAADYRYRVELPDGGSEDVQTKDDVKAILFREY
ncbi:hypothetical protein [Halovivax gelatinilyticus]|uniref:hypothetical protein n=1 Tax=Halovivax gelatinilyticus TaxID=2961597 RepID=UPI0020CA8333|nr:hypothetical protein [Halovivax gelatinilyticus]